MYTKKVECTKLTVGEIISLLSTYNPGDELCICGSAIYYAYSGDGYVSLDYDSGVDDCDDGIEEEKFDKEKCPNPSNILKKILKNLYQPDEVEILKDELLNLESEINFSVEEINYMYKLLKEYN